MPRYRVSGRVVQDISVEVEADDRDDAIDVADLMPTTAHIVWDVTKLWDDVEVIHSEEWD